MPGISSGIRGDGNLLNLREIPVANIRPELTMFLIPGENITQAFQTIRDQVVFTNKRLIVANVQEKGILYLLSLLEDSVFQRGDRRFPGHRQRTAPRLFERRTPAARLHFKRGY